MRAPFVIILTSGESRYATGSIIDDIVGVCVKMNRKPVVVLGPDGDDFLLSSSEIEKCELVFDPNYQGSLFSGIKAGLHATDASAFVVSPRSWINAQEFERCLLTLEESIPGDGSDADFEAASLMTQEGASAYLITPKGAKTLKALPSSTDFHSRLVISLPARASA